jgi:hypothetical protein
MSRHVTSGVVSILNAALETLQNEAPEDSYDLISAIVETYADEGEVREAAQKQGLFSTLFARFADGTYSQSSLACLFSLLNPNDAMDPSWDLVFSVSIVYRLYIDYRCEDRKKVGDLRGDIGAI